MSCCPFHLLLLLLLLLLLYRPTDIGACERRHEMLASCFLFAEKIYPEFIATSFKTRIEYIPRSFVAQATSYFKKFKGTFFQRNELKHVINIGYVCGGGTITTKILTKTTPGSNISTQNDYARISYIQQTKVQILALLRDITKLKRSIFGPCLL